jgi:type VI secretion system secreted protein VgrG
VFTGTVTNTGNVTLTNVLVVDNQPAPNTPVLGPITLAPGAGTSFAASYTAPADGCSTTDTLLATGNDKSTGITVTNTVSATCPILSVPSIAVTQDCPPGPVSPGGLLTYSGSVRNAGSTTLSNVFVVNNQPLPNTPVAGPLTLTPGASSFFTGSFTAPADACSVSSTITATGSGRCAGLLVANTASATCTLVATPLLVVTQTCPATPVSPGGLLTYSGTISNAGNITLTNVVVVNNLSGATPVFTAATLHPGAVADFTGSYLAPANCSSTSTSTGTGQSICGAAVTNTASTTCPITTTPRLVVTQTCPATPVSPGGLLTYSGTISNAGNIMLTSVVVVNNLSGATPVFTAATLAPGAVAGFTGSYLAPTNCSSTSTSTATGQSICGAAVNNTASAACPIITTPGITVTESCPPGPVSAGSSVDFSGLVGNSGNITLTNVLVASGQPVSNTLVLGPITLAPGASAPFTGSYIATGGSNPATNSTIVTNTSGTITTNTTTTIVTNTTVTVTPGEVNLGTANNFGVLAGSTVTSTGGTAVHGGNVGVSPGTAITGFPPGTVAAPYITYSAGAVPGQAETDLAVAYNTAAGLAPTHVLTGTDLGGLTLTPGVYFFASSAQLTGTLTLNDQNNPDAVFVFQIGSTLTTAAGSAVITENAGGSAPGMSVFWQVGSSATLGAGTAFEGNILALASITDDGGSTVGGRLLARGGAVTLAGTTVTVPPAEVISTTVTNYTTNTVTTVVTNTVTTYTTNITVTFTPTNTVTATGMDICQARTAAAAADCLGPVPLVVERDPSVQLLVSIIGAPSLANGLFAFPTETGKSYTVQYKNSLSDPAWTDLETVAGTGGNLPITDPAAPRQPARFYRVISTP